MPTALTSSDDQFPPVKTGGYRTGNFFSGGRFYVIKKPNPEASLLLARNILPQRREVQFICRVDDPQKEPGALFQAVCRDNLWIIKVRVIDHGIDNVNARRVGEYLA